jgi:TatD DNase family protein
LQVAAAAVPDELLLLETDAPYLAPVPHRGRPNEPAYVMDTLAFVAGLRGRTSDALARQVEENAGRAFRLP